MNPLKRLIGAILHFFEHKEIHAFQVPLGDRVYFVCARCSGLYLSVAVCFPLVLLLHHVTPSLFLIGDFLTDLFCLFLILPTLVDWTTQRLALRESTNRIRFTTAFLAGFSLDWYLLSPVHILHKIIFIFVIFAFIMIFSNIDRRPSSIETTPEGQDSEPDTEPSALFSR